MIGVGICWTAALAVVPDHFKSAFWQSSCVLGVLLLVILAVTYIPAVAKFKQKKVSKSMAALSLIFVIGGLLSVIVWLIADPSDRLDGEGETQRSQTDNNQTPNASKAGIKSREEKQSGTRPDVRIKVLKVLTLTNSDKLFGWLPAGSPIFMVGVEVTNLDIPSAVRNYRMKLSVGGKEFWGRVIEPVSPMIFGGKPRSGEPVLKYDSSVFIPLITQEPVIKGAVKTGYLGAGFPDILARDTAVLGASISIEATDVWGEKNTSPEFSIEKMDPFNPESGVQGLKPITGRLEVLEHKTAPPVPPVQTKEKSHPEETK